ncbi:MAG: ATP-dependent Clp protease proteolytic subunit [Clostridia bacterium]|nr:ATP-dependent Clp protease proteolytic subunit [Clostridia bacterium]
MSSKKSDRYEDSITDPVKVSPPEGEENDSQSDGTDREIKQIVETGSITVDKRGHYIHCLTIIGQIEGHYILPPQNKTTKYEHVIPQLVAIEESRDVEGLLIILNTVGGDIEAGLAIAELIAGMKTPTVSLVLGGGHSIGVPLAASSAYSFIAPSATMTVHPVRMTGLVLGVPQTMSYFEQMQERIVRFVADNSNISADRFRELMLATGELVMDVGTVLDGEAAVNEGLIDSLGSLSDALDKLCDMIEENNSDSNGNEDDS